MLSIKILSLSVSMLELKEFAKQFEEKEVPALASTLKAISEIHEDSDIPIERLADIIKQDASMTAHILRHTQGAYRIPVVGKKNTVNRAIVMLGFREIKALCLTLSIVDGLASKSVNDHLLSEFGKTFHGAIQARGISLLKGIRNCEEVFTSAILSRLGYLAFWSMNDPRAEELITKYKGQPDSEHSSIEKSVLGFSLSELSEKLFSVWGLGSYGRPESGASAEELKKWQSIDLGIQLSSIVKSGWDSSGAISVVREISNFLELPFETTLGTLRETTIIAGNAAADLSVPGLSGDHIKESLEFKNKESLKEESKEAPVIFNEPDPTFQLKVLKEITILIEAGTDVNEVIGMALEGINRGIGFNRVIFALITPNRKQLRGKSILGSRCIRALESFQIALKPGAEDPFNLCLESKEAIWLVNGFSTGEYDKLPDEILDSLGDNESILLPVIVSNQTIGVFYVDNCHSKKEISHEDFASVKQFVFQIQLSLEYMQNHGSGPKLKRQ